jgi:hypothetical protein
MNNMKLMKAIQLQWEQNNLSPHQVKVTLRNPFV